MSEDSAETYVTDSDVRRAELRAVEERVADRLQIIARLRHRFGLPVEMTPWIGSQVDREDNTEAVNLIAKIDTLAPRILEFIKAMSPPQRPFEPPPTSEVMAAAMLAATHPPQVGSGG